MFRGKAQLHRAAWTLIHISALVVVAEHAPLQLGPHNRCSVSIGNRGSIFFCVCSEDLDLDIPFQKHGEDLDLPFHANGVDREVDELDFKLIQRRCSPNPSRDDNPLPVTCVPYIPPTNAGVGVANATEQPMTIQQLRLLAYRQRNNKGDQKNCVFCKNNGEAVFIYTSHCLKDENGRVLCPILREYKCPNCNAFGDNAHTLKYCPLSPDMPGMGALRTARTSTGKRRTLKPSDLPERLGRRPPPSQLLPADKFHKVIAPLL